MNALLYGHTLFAVTRHTMSSFRPSSQSLKMIHVVAEKILLLFAVFFCLLKDFRVGGVGSDQWIRLCTFTSNGSSQMNVTMPCGVHVRSNELKDDYKDNTSVSESWPVVDDSVEYVKITLDGGRNTATPEKHAGNSTNRQDGDLTTKYSNNKTSEGQAQEEEDVEEEGDAEEGDVEEEEDVEEERDEGKDDEKEKDAGTDAEDENDDHDVEIDIGDDDEGQSTYDEDVTVLNVEANEGASEEIDEISGMEDQLKNRRRGTAVSKVMLGYLLDARNQLYNKIHYLLDLLQQTFFNLKLNCRRRRNSIERRSLFNNKRIQGNKKNPSFSSMILEPTFERSIMTMSFLMFGVFVIQVVQKLMQTIQQPGENSFIENSIFGNLPTASSSIF